MAARSDENEIAATDPKQVADYLLSRGWVVEDQVPNKTIVWGFQNKTSLWQPLRRETKDYKRLLIELFTTLEKLEGRSRRDILQDLALEWSDVLRFRISTGLISSSLPLLNGVLAIKNARDVIVAGSRSLVEPRGAYYEKPSGKTSQFLKQLRLGQTEIGSFVITVISPLNIADSDFARQSMQQVHNAVNAAHTVSENLHAERSMSLVDDAISQGLSANLCDALYVLGTASGDNAVEIGFSSSTRSAPLTQQNDSIIFGAPALRSLKIASEYLREKEPVKDFEIRGAIETMSDRSDSDSVSEMTISAAFEGKLRKIKFLVEGQNRREAIRAFDHRWPIAVVGTLKINRDQFTIENIISFREIKEGEELNLEIDESLD